MTNHSTTFANASETNNPELFWLLRVADPTTNEAAELAGWGMDNAAADRALASEAEAEFGDWLASLN